jgi:hypothetical protein
MHLKIMFLCRGLKLANSGHGGKFQLFNSLWNRILQRLPDIKLIQVSSTFSIILEGYYLFTAENKGIGFSNCHALCVQRKTTILTSIAYACNDQYSYLHKIILAIFTLYFTSYSPQPTCDVYISFE